MSAPRQVFEALGDETRLAIVDRLASRGPLATLELVEGLGMSRQAATKHLMVLESAGIVQSCSHGRKVMRQLAPEALKSAREWLDDRARFWESKLTKLAQVLEQPGERAAE